MVAALAVVHPANMANGRTGPGHYLREWRKHRGLTLEQVAEKVELLGAERAVADPDVRPISMTHATLSRIERGKLPYNQSLLELLATIYQTEASSLIRLNPLTPGALIYSLWETLERMPPAQQRQAVEIINAIRRTGSDD